MSGSEHRGARARKGRFPGYLGQYAAAIVAVSASLATRIALSTAFGPNLPVYLFFCPAVIVVAFVAGIGPGLAATAAAILETTFWVYPAGHLLADQVTSLLLFCAVGILTSVFAGLYRRAMQRTAFGEQESAARAGEAHFLTMFHLSPISMSLIRMSNGECHDANQAHVSLFGFSRDETVGHTGPELNMWVQPHDREGVLEILSRGEKLINFEAELRRKPGDTVTTLISAEVIRLSGEPFFWMMHTDITERKRTEEKFRLVVETAPMGLIIVNRQGHVVLVNAQAERQFGYLRSELLGGPVETLIPERLRSMHTGHRSEYSADPQPRDMGKGRDLFGVRRDGTEFPVEVGLTPIEMHGGAHVMASIIDISERKRIEGALRESDIALQTLVDAIPGMVLLMDTKGTVLAANETIARRLGTSAAQIIGQDAYDRLPPEVARTARAYSDEVIRSGEPRHYEDSQAGMHFDNYLHPIGDGKGNVTRLAVLALDVTERKMAEAKMKEQAALLDIASDAILTKKLDGRIVYWNKGAERLYGWSAEEAAEKQSLELLYDEEHSSQGREAQEQAIEKGEWRGELHQRTKGGNRLIVGARWTLIRDDKGEPSGVLSVNTDVTAQRAIERQLLRSQRLESLGTLAGGIAHDLNNVLAPILMGVEGLALRNPDFSGGSILSIIKASAQRGANIVRQILNFARGMEGDIGEIQVGHVVREVEGIIQETFPKSIELNAGIPKDLWPINGDATQLHQVLMNLCVNARDAMPDGGMITLSAENVSLDETYARMNIDAKPIKYVILKVEDTGTGMPPGVLEKIFDPFFTTKEPGKGTGLGLSTVRTIVKSHGGFMTVYSEPGEGTSFRVYIPASEQGMQPKESAPEQGIPMGAGESILVVDDEASLRDMTRQILESCAYKVTTAADGTEAVARFAEHKADFQVVLTDMMMPYMDGPATIRAIRRIDPEARFIATSGLTTGEHEKAARGLGVRTFLAKPYTAEKLLQTIRKVLDQKSEESGP
jgi:PAS domain S-box-containing protein